MYGFADYLGGIGSRRSHHGAVVLIAHALVVGPLLLLSAVLPYDSLTGRDLALGAFGGAAGGLGLLGLFYGLANGRMTVVAPITAVVSAGLPALWGTVDGEHLSRGRVLGILLALAAIVLITQEREVSDQQRTPPAVLIIAFVAGIAFGVYLTAMSETSDDAGLWPLAAGRVASTIVLATVTLALPRWRVHLMALSRPVMIIIVGSAILDVLANMAFLFSVRAEGALLAITAVLTSLYPTVTVLAARIQLREHLQSAQIAGLILAAGGIAFVAAG